MGLFDLVASKHVPQDILLRVQSQYNCVCTLYPETKPVKKVGQIICGHGGQFFIDYLVVEVRYHEDSHLQTT